MSTPLPLFLRAWLHLAAFALLAVTAGAQSALPPTVASLDSLAAFKSVPANWQLAGGLDGDPRREKSLTPVSGSGILVNNPTAAAHGHLFTAWEHGDIEVDLDFLMTPGSNSGVYLMGRYEVQLFDSWGVPNPTFADCGGIYERWDDRRGPDKEGFEGTAPRANASRAPGLWQHLHIEFQAPQFDAAGKKNANARFLKVLLNGYLVQENVEVTGPTRSAAFADEAATGPLMIQGDHGPVAIRALTYRKFEPGAMPLRLENLAYKLYNAESDEVGSCDSAAPREKGPATELGIEAFVKAGKFAVVYTGSLVASRDGLYAFATANREPVRLLIDDQVALADSSGGGETVPLHLTTGTHTFRLDYIHSGWGRPWFNLSVEGPGFGSHLLSAEGSGRRRDGKPRQILIEPPADRVRTQRSFVPFEPKKRLYAINVGTPAGLNYSYDFETGAILRVWRGDFLDTFEMWDGRGENQIAKPAGPALTLPNKPVLALLEASSNDWPDLPDAMWSSQGYRLEPNGQPVFSFKLASLSATDRIAPDAANHGFTRTLVVTGHTTDWQSWVLLAVADRITAQPGGQGYVIGDRAYYVDLPANSAVHPIVRTRNGHRQLAVPIGRSALGKPIVYTLVW